MADFTGRLEYALLAAVDLAARYDPKAFVKVGAIARRTGAPEKYLGQILLRLKARALVRSASGPTGGYRLMRRPEMISVAEVIEAVACPGDGRRRRSIPPGPYTPAVDWLAASIREGRRRLLSSITLANLAEHAAGEA